MPFQSNRERRLRNTGVHYVHPYCQTKVYKVIFSLLLDHGIVTQIHPSLFRIRKIEDESNDSFHRRTTVREGGDSSTGLAPYGRENAHCSRTSIIGIICWALLASSWHQREREMHPLMDKKAKQSKSICCCNKEQQILSDPSIRASMAMMVSIDRLIDRWRYRSIGIA